MKLLVNARERWPRLFVVMLAEYFLHTAVGLRPQPVLRVPLRRPSSPPVQRLLSSMRIKDFVSPKERAAVVLAAVEELLAHHREEEIAALLERLRAVLEGKGPLAVGYDPSKITATGALAVRASIVSADAHATLESLSNPIRRLVLRRLSEGSCTFTQAMEAAHIDDTSKIAFHLRKLTESGLVAHLARERYQLTEREKGRSRSSDRSTTSTPEGTETGFSLENTPQGSGVTGAARPVGRRLRPPESLKFPWISPDLGGIY